MPRAPAGRFDYAFSIFVGLIVFNLFAEIAYRSPLLLAEHKHIIRRSIFPPQILAWIAVARAFVYALIAIAVLLAGLVAIAHTVHATWLAVPFILLPLALTLLGIVWVLSTIGALTGDLNHLIVSIIPAAMFATPVFYEGLGRSRGMAAAALRQSPDGLHRDAAPGPAQGRAAEPCSLLRRVCRGAGDVLSRPQPVHAKEEHSCRHHLISPSPAKAWARPISSIAGRSTR